MSFWKLVRWGGFSVLVLVICVVLVFIFGSFGWEGAGFYGGKPWDLTGFSGTKLWYWLDLLLVPAVLALSAFLFNRAQIKRQQATEEQRARNAALQAYLDHVGGLLADKKLSPSQPDEDARTVARARTLTVLNSLAPAGKRNILQFLYQANLISKQQTIVDIEGANLSGASLGRAVLSEINLSRVIMSGANLGGAVLRKADLREAMLGSYEMLRTSPPRARPMMFEGDLSSVSMNSADLSGADLRGADLRGAKMLGTDLRGADLHGANLLDADLRRVVMSSADLFEADLRGADLNGADLRGADLRGANLLDADLRGVNLFEADLRGADLNGADLRGADLRGARVLGTELRRADLRDAKLRDADLSGAELRGASISGVSLRGVNLNGASLSGANLSHTNLRDAKLNHADLRDANLFEADLRDANLLGADLRGAILARAKLFGTGLKGSDLRGANLFEADLRRVVLRNADLSETNLCRAKLFGTELRGSDLNRAKLFGTDLSGADLRDADLHRSTGVSYANLRGADLRGADLRGADLNRTGIRHADLSGADLDGTDSVSSSRDSLAGAGWFSAKVGGSPSARRPLSWVNPAPLWRSRNQLLADHFGDLTNDERRRWMKVQREAGQLPEDLIIKDHADIEKVSFLVLGDTGRGDASQYAVGKSLLARGWDTHFIVICGDVVYPAGDIEDYEAKFYEPYKGYQRPILGLPGNHDWYDGLNGFMYHLCGVEASALIAMEDEALSRKEGLRQLLWRKPKVDPSRLPERKRIEGDQRSNQRSPYFAVEAGPLLIVGIDTGISGGIDREQGEWLRNISREIDKPKILLMGKPIYVDGEYHPRVIEGGGTVDDIVRAPEHNYVAVIGQDTHNYQRYSVKVEGREDPIYYLISGGGGASMHATHKIPKVELNGVDEDGFVCYPRRGDSLSFYSKLYDRRFSFKKGWLEIPPDEAAAYMGERLGITPEREEDRKTYVSRRTRRLADRIFPLPGRGRGSLHYYFSELFDWNELPLFKNFLRIDVSESELRICCFAATGCLEHEKSPPVEDEIKIKLPMLAEGRA